MKTNTHEPRPPSGQGHQHHSLHVHILSHWDVSGQEVTPMELSPPVTALPASGTAPEGPPETLVGGGTLSRAVFVLVCLFHRRSACEQIMLHEQSSLVIKTFQCPVHVFRLFKELAEVCKASANPFTECSWGFFFFFFSCLLQLCVPVPPTVP